LFFSFHFLNIVDNVTIICWQKYLAGFRSLLEIIDIIPKSLYDNWFLPSSIGII